MKSPKALRTLISVLLIINPEPSDEQFHALAEAAGVDKEELEAIAYSMLSEAEEGAVEIEADSQEVLDDVTLDPDEVPLNDVAMNDGEPTNEDIGYQDETDDDGADVHDIGVGLAGGGADLLNDDGLPDVGGA